MVFTHLRASAIPNTFCPCVPEGNLNIVQRPEGDGIIKSNLFGIQLTRSWNADAAQNEDYYWHIRSRCSFMPTQEKSSTQYSTPVDGIWSIILAYHYQASKV